MTYYGQVGYQWSDGRMPMLAGDDYLSYLTDLGLTAYSDMNKLFGYFPFLNDPDNSNYYYTYNNHTDWQDQIYRNALSTDHLVRIEGGDNIAKYDLSLGYTLDNGTLIGTDNQKYHAQLNGNILVNRKWSIFTTIGLAYMDGDFQEQGLNLSVNPLLAALAQSPVLSPYQKARDGNVLSSYSSYNFGKTTSSTFQVSNPVAIVNTMQVSNRQFDVNLRAGITYSPTADLSLNGVVGLQYNYDNEHLFIPGKSENTIIPVSDQYGTAENLSRSGVAESMNMFYGLNARYNHTWQRIHRLNAYLGLQALTTSHEYDGGEGRNSSNDFYKTLNYTTGVGRHLYGYQQLWNWLDTYAHADYTLNDLVQGSVNLSMDASSATGLDAPRFYLYPSAGITLLGKNFGPLQDLTAVNRLNLRAEWSQTGNSRFDSEMSRYLYYSKSYDQISAIVRGGMPNTSLRPERVSSFNVSADLSLLHDRIGLRAERFDSRTTDMIVARSTSSLYGSIASYENLGSMHSQGTELSVELTPLRTRRFEWVLGGNVTKAASTVTSLGQAEQILLTPDNDVQIVTVVGQAPYQFYGYHVLGVFSTQAEADAANLVNTSGDRYNAGDIHYEDVNGDGRISSLDRQLLGSAQADFYGGLWSQIRYRGFALRGNFAYSVGNKAYNAVRRQTESMKNFSNQSTAAANRWIIEGQVTDVPRASYGDPMNNSGFSDRWIEDASYLRLKSLTLSYSFDQVVLGFFRSGTLYVSGENLYTLTDYLGLDPEFSLSGEEYVQGLDYGKTQLPKSVKFGVNLKF